MAEYCDGQWHQGVIGPYAPLTLAPSISALQYGIAVFEGLKAYRTRAGDIALFRPRENARRLNRSAARLAMPPVPEQVFLDGVRQLVGLDRGMGPGGSRGRALHSRVLLLDRRDDPAGRHARQRRRAAG